MCLLKIQMWSLKPLDVLRMIKSHWTVAYWKITSVLLDIKIRTIAHEKAPCFKANCWGQKVKRVVATKGS